PTVLVEEVLLLFDVVPGIFGAFSTAFIAAGLTEVFFNWILVWMVAYRSISFNEKLDGIVYSVFACMSLDNLEDIMYVVYRYINNPYIGLYRDIFSVPAHAVFGVTMGYYLSLAKFSPIKARTRANYIKSLLMPVIFHGIFDFILMANLPQLTVFFVPYVIYLWWLNQKKLSHYVYDSKTKYIDRNREE